MTMDYKKIGKFIAKLRKDEKMTQEELANLLFVERETISKWERGINNISMDNILKICDIFKITINEIILGERINTDNINEISNVTVGILKDNTKIKRYLISSIILILILIVSFLGYYFLNNYNSIKVYDINGENEYFSIHDGLMVISRDKVYIQLNNIEIVDNSDIISTRLYYKKNGEEITLFENDDLGGSYVSNYNDSVLQYKDLKYVIANMFLEIDFDGNNTSVQQLELIESYSNTNLFTKKTNSLKKEDINELDERIPKYIKDNFKFDNNENAYLFEEKNNNKIIIHKYFYEANVYVVDEISEDFIENYTYSYPDITYTKSDIEGNIKDEFLYILDTKKCFSDKCDIEKVEYFENTYLSRIEFE